MITTEKLMQQRAELAAVEAKLRASVVNVGVAVSVIDQLLVVSKAEDDERIQAEAERLAAEHREHEEAMDAIDDDEVAVCDPDWRPAAQPPDPEDEAIQSARPTLEQAFADQLERDEIRAEAHPYIDDPENDPAVVEALTSEAGRIDPGELAVALKE